MLSFNVIYWSLLVLGFILNIYILETDWMPVLRWMKDNVLLPIRRYMAQMSPRVTLAMVVMLAVWGLTSMSFDPTSPTYGLNYFDCLLNVSSLLTFTIVFRNEYRAKILAWHATWSTQPKEVLCPRKPRASRPSSC